MFIRAWFKAANTGRNLKVQQQGIGKMGDGDAFCGTLCAHLKMTHAYLYCLKNVTSN